MTDILEAEKVSTIRITIDGETGEWPAKRFCNKFLLVKLMPDIGRGDLFELTAVTRMVESQVLPEQHPLLAEWLEAHGDSSEYAGALWEGLNGCWAGETHLPLASVSDSSEPISRPGTEDTSTDGSSSPVTQE